MKKLLIFLSSIAIVFAINSCEKENDGLYANEVQLKNISTKNDKLNGYDEWGFNYQAQHFNGYLINMALSDPTFVNFPHYKKYVYNGEGQEFWDMLISNHPYFGYIIPEFLLDCKLKSHWNDGLLSKEGVYPATWVDSNGWITFKYSMGEGDEYWSHFRKLESLESTDILVDGFWYNEEGKEVGMYSKFWPEGLKIIQVVNVGDVNTDVFYPVYNAPFSSGLGN